MTDAIDSEDTSDFDEFQDELKPGTQLLQGQYTIDKYLNSGGFAITYLARDSLDRQVVIKECFPGSFCRRSRALVQARSRAHQNEYKAIVRLFIQEARGLAKLSHPNIVGVHQVFEDNSTAYMALDLIKGRDLLDTLEDETGQLTPIQVTGILKKILGAIKYMHDQNVLHRDISPDNILLNEDLEPILIDFGAAREQASKVGKVLSALRVVKDGYSPQEFYVSGSIQGPSSDLYALGATFYHLITGDIPPDSQIRLASAAAREPDPYKPLHGNIMGYDDIFLMAIDKSLRLMPKDRLQTAEEWLAKIDHKDFVKTESADDDVTATVAQIMQQPGVAAPPPPKAKPKPKPVTATPQPVKGAPAAGNPAKNRLDEIANEMASEASEKKKSAGKIIAGMAVAAALAGAVVYTQTDLLIEAPGNDTGLGDSEISSSDTSPQTSASSNDTTDASAPVDPEAGTDGIETTVAQPSDSETTSPLEHVPDTGGTTEEPETMAPVGTDQGVSVAQAPEATAKSEVLTSFTPVDFDDAEIALTEPKITEITEVSLVLPRIQGLKVSDSGLGLSAALSEPVAADAVSFGLEASGVAPAFGADIEQSLPEQTLDTGLSLSSGDNALTIPKSVQPALGVTNLAALETQVPKAEPKILTAPIALSSIITPTTYLTTSWTAQLPFEADESNGVTIKRVKSGADAWMEEGMTIATLNGEPVETIADISRILERVVTENDAATIAVTFGTEDAAGVVAQHDATLKALGISTLDDGTVFETIFESGIWKTMVAAVPDNNTGEFIVGDIVIGNVDVKKKIEGRNTLVEILNQGFSTGQNSLRFIVDRNGSNWFATIRVSQVGGYQKTSLSNSNSGD
ncbi:Serine/threonine protein kinase [hydrothermal vent metagenome]|uniref:Serine/threonine protein kinase n=1 Tax=hydrothermal vent metagenome TaxID=652676 RepID=A0A3B0RFV3_9ZZZZ